MAQNPQFLTLLTSKCASRHNGVHFFDIDLPSNRQKVARTPGVLTLFTSKCASRHNGVHFFHISTSKSRPKPRCFATFYFKMCFAPQRRALFPHLNFQKSSDPEVFCHIFTSKCAWRHNGVHFFHISTSKSRPRMVCFVHFDFQMCFAPQRRALFPQLNFQKSSEPDVFCHFSVQNVLRATTACTFSTTQLPKVVRA